MSKILLDTGSSGPKGWSRSSQILRCARRSRLQAAGYAEADRDALVKGSLAHAGCAHYYARLQAVQQGWDPDAFYTPAEAIGILAQHGGLWAKFAPEVQVAVASYQRTMSAFPEYVIAVEHLVEVPVPRTFGRELRPGPLTDAIMAAVPDPIIHRMRVDLILQLTDGRYLVIDHKSNSSYKSAATAPFDLSGQILALRWWGQRVYGDRFAGVEIGAIGLKSDIIERLTPQAAPHAVASWPVTRTWAEVQRAMGDALYGDGLDWPMALSDQGPCLDRYGPCGFRDSCRLGLPQPAASRDGDDL